MNDEPYYRPMPMNGGAPSPALSGRLHAFLYRTKWWSNCAAGTAIFAILLVIGSCVLGGIALSAARYKDTIASYTQSGVISSTPYKIRLDGLSALSMTFPNDLTPYLGATYVISAGTAQAHTVTISAGSISTTYDGVSTIATLGGAIGDGFMVEVISRDRMVILSNTNTAFS